MTSSSLRLAVLVGLVASVAIGAASCSSDDGPPATSGSGATSLGAGAGGTGGSGGQGGQGGEPECALGTDCGEDSTCTTFTCDEGACATVHTAAMTACADGAVDECDQEQDECLCDGEGACVLPTCMDGVTNTSETDVDSQQRPSQCQW